MSTRTRSRAQARSHIARQQRAVVSARRRQPRITPRHLVTSLALAAELGHLAAVLTEWSAAPQRGLVHVLLAACLGLIAVTVYFGPTRPGSVAGIVLALATVAAWPAGALLGASPYQQFPPAAILVLSTVELALAGFAVLSLTNRAVQP